MFVFLFRDGNLFLTPRDSFYAEKNCKLDNTVNLALLKITVVHLIRGERRWETTAAFVAINFVTFKFTLNLSAI